MKNAIHTRNWSYEYNRFTKKQQKVDIEYKILSNNNYNIHFQNYKNKNKRTL